MKDEKLIRALRAAADRAQGAGAESAINAPLGDDFEARVTAEILAAQSLEASRRPRAAPAPERRTVRAAILRRTPLRALGALAAAAALLLALTRPWGTAKTGATGGVADLPLYAMTVTGGQDTMRGGLGPTTSAQVPTTQAVAPDAPLTVVLRPPVDVSGALAVRLFASRGGRAHEVHAAVRTAPSGAVEVRGSARELLGDPPGEAALVVVIAREGTSVDAHAVAEGATAPRGVSVTTVPVRVLP